MKRLLYSGLAALLAVVASCSHRGEMRQAADAGDGDGALDKIVELKTTTLMYPAKEYDFGRVREGRKVKHAFEVVNTGAEDLLILNVTASCGCTASDFSGKPIPPGGRGEIEVVFNTRGRPGRQRKSVMVTTNTEPPNTVLFFTCDVEPRPK